MQYDQKGSWLAIAGIIVSLASHLGISITVDDVLAIIGAVAIIYGVIHQYIAHRKLAVEVGAVL